MLQSTGLQRVGHDLATEQQQQKIDVSVSDASFPKVIQFPETGSFFPFHVQVNSDP